MTFADAMGTLASGGAAKRPSWGGYVTKTVTSESGAATETGKVTYKNRAGTTYEYTYSGTTWTAPATTVPYDAELHAAMLATDWITGTATDFETARTGGGTW